MEAIELHIDAAQDAHDEELKELEEQHEKDKENLFDKHVRQILSKII